MASQVLGVNKTKYDAGASGDNYIPMGQYGNKKFVIYDTYEASALTTGSTITMMTLPKGARITELKVYFDALGSGTSLDVGDSLESQRYFGNLSTVSADVSAFVKSTGYFYEIGTTSGDETIILTTTDIMTGTIKLVVSFVKG